MEDKRRDLILDTLSEIFDLNEENKLVLPDFQRDYVWEIEKQKRLLSSFLTSLPVGSILVLKGRKKDFAAKELCFIKELNLDPEQELEECYFLLDGQQRISTLKSIFNDFFYDTDNWLDIYTKLYPKLQNRWFLRIQPKDGEDDIFGWDNLSFTGLNELEPDQVFEFIECKKIFKTKDFDKWFHPNFSPKDSNGKPIIKSKLKRLIAKEAAKESLVPLYSVYQSPFKEKDSVPLHEYVLQRIASERVEELKDEVNDGNKNIIELLSEIEPDIAEFVEENDENQIRNAWSRLEAKWVEKVNKFLTEIIEQSIPRIELPSDQISRAIAIFENINSNPTDLDNFDIIVAKAARDKENKSLTLRILNILKKEISLSKELLNDILGNNPSYWTPEKMGTIDNNEISKTIKKQFLNLLSIISHYTNGNDTTLRVEHIKRKKHLSLTHIQIKENTELVLKSLIRALAFLHFRCGIVKISSISYDLMLLPIAYVLRNDEVWTNKKKLARIEYWYWVSLFCGSYRERQNDRCINDILNLENWLNNGNNPYESRYEFVLNERGYSDKNLLMMKDKHHSIPKAIRTGVLQYILSRQPIDFLPRSNNPLYLNTWDIADEKNCTYENESFILKIQDHHVCPLAEVTSIGETTTKLRNQKDHILNSPLNRTYISSFANAKISSKSPSEYLKYVPNSAIRNHFLPTPFQEHYSKKNNESNEQYYERILASRYEKLKEAILDELDRLLLIT